MLREPSARALRWWLTVCVALVLAHVVGWFIFGFRVYTLIALAGVTCIGLALALTLREMRKREREGDSA